MEVIKAILGLIVGVMVLSVLFQLIGPILLIIFVIFAISSVRIWYMNRNIRGQGNYSRRETYSQSNNRQNRQTNTSSKRPTDVIDAEFTEEEIID